MDNLHFWPSLLTADLLHLAKDLDIFQAQGVNQIHLDIMDNHYVPNLSFGPEICQQIRKKYPTMCIDVHLMIQPVEEMIMKFAKHGANRIAIHANKAEILSESLALIQRHHCRAGLAINPNDTLDALHTVSHQLDYILVMTVQPGFGGQTIISEVFDKISRIHACYPAIPMMVDGGVNLSNILSLKKQGATDFVVGSGYFQATDYPHCLAKFLEITA